MTLLDRYLFQRTFAALLRTLVSLLLIYVVFDLLTHRSAAILQNDVPWSVVLAYYSWELPIVLYQFQLAPLAMLVAALLVLGAAAQHNEFTAMLAGGIGLRRIILGPVLVAVLLTVAVFSLQETVGVQAAERTQSIVARYFAHNPEENRSGISWTNLAGGWKCHIRKFNRIALTGEDALLLLYQPDRVQRIEARRIYWDDALRHWILEDGVASIFFPREAMAARHNRVTQTVAPITESPDDLFAIDKNPAAQTATELMANIERAESRGVPVHRLKVDWHGKFAKPALCFVMIWLAVPFALRLRLGGIGVGFGLSIAIALAYLLVFGLIQGLGYLGRIPPIAAAWGANLLFLGLGLVLYLRTPT